MAQQSNLVNLYLQDIKGKQVLQVVNSGKNLIVGSSGVVGSNSGNQIVKNSLGQPIKIKTITSQNPKNNQMNIITSNSSQVVRTFVPVGPKLVQIQPAVTGQKVKLQNAQSLQSSGGGIKVIPATNQLQKLRQQTTNSSGQVIQMSSNGGSSSKSTSACPATTTTYYVTTTATNQKNSNSLLHNNNNLIIGEVVNGDSVVLEQHQQQKQLILNNNQNKIYISTPQKLTTTSSMSGGGSSYQHQANILLNPSTNGQHTASVIKTIQKKPLLNNSTVTKTQDSSIDYHQMQTSKRRRNDKSGKGLRHFSMKVCEKVRRKGTTSYNEVADELVNEFTQQQQLTGSAEQYDQKNIRRRVYDALNVLMAMNIISKEKKEIKWLGLPTNSAQECTMLEQEKRSKIESIRQKEQQLRDLIYQQISFKNLVERNRDNEQLCGAPPVNSTIPLPFILINTSKDGSINCSMTNDKTEYNFQFTHAFQIHDDIEVLKRIGMLMGLDHPSTNGAILDPANLLKAKKMLPKSLENYIEQIAYGMNGNSSSNSTSDPLIDNIINSYDDDDDDDSKLMSGNRTKMERHNIMLMSPIKSGVVFNDISQQSLSFSSDNSRHTNSPSNVTESTHDYSEDEEEDLEMDIEIDDLTVGVDGDEISTNFNKSCEDNQ